MAAPQPQYSSDQDLIIYEVINKHFRQDVREFWARSNFYLLIHAGLFSVYVALMPNTSAQTHNKRAELSIAALGALGLALSVIWFLVARASVAWIRKWRQEMIELDNALNPHKCYSRIERYAIEHPAKSPSNITQYVPLFFGAAWLFLLGMQLLN